MNAQSRHKRRSEGQRKREGEEERLGHEGVQTLRMGDGGWGMGHTKDEERETGRRYGTRAVLLGSPICMPRNKSNSNNSETIKKFLKQIKS